MLESVRSCLLFIGFILKFVCFVLRIGFTSLNRKFLLGKIEVQDDKRQLGLDEERYSFRDLREDRVCWDLSFSLRGRVLHNEEIESETLFVVFET